MPRPRVPDSPFKRFNSSPEVIRLVVMMYVRFPLSLRNVEDLLFERGIDICHETVRFWWNRFGPMFAAIVVGASARCVASVRQGHPLVDRLCPPTAICVRSIKYGNIYGFINILQNIIINQGNLHDSRSAN